MYTVSRTELLNKLLSGPRPTLIEALPERFFQSGHLPGAININHDAIKTMVRTALPDKTVEIVVYCANAACQNSDMAAVQLIAMGYQRVGVYKAGKQDWQEAGLLLEAGRLLDENLSLDEVKP